MYKFTVSSVQLGTITKRERITETIPSPEGGEEATVINRDVVSNVACYQITLIPEDKEKIGSIVIKQEKGDEGLGFAVGDTYELTLKKA